MASHSPIRKDAPRLQRVHDLAEAIVASCDELAEMSDSDRSSDDNHDAVAAEHSIRCNVARLAES
jgi:hypothetical protein